MDKTENLRIVLITMLFPNKLEPGKTTFVLEIAKELSKHAEIKVIAPVRKLPLGGISKRMIKGYSDSSKIEFYEKLEGLDVYHPKIFLPPKVFRFLHGFLYFLAVKKLTKNLSEQFDFDLILSPYLFPDGFASVLIAKYLNKPVVIEARGCDVNLLTQYILRRALIKYACKNANAIITVNRDLKDKLIKIGVKDSKTFVIYNGVNCDNFRPSDTKYSRLKAGLPLNKKIVLFVGSLEKVKGISYLIESWRDLIKIFGQEILLILIGEGNERNNISRLVRRYNLQRSVLLVGAKPHSEIPIWLNSCDIFCLPSIREGYPNVLLEAISCNKYIVASKVGGIPEIINSSDAGILVEPGSASSLSEGLKTALSNSTFNRANKVSNLSLKSWKESVLERITLFKKICV